MIMDLKSSPTLTGDSIQLELISNQHREGLCHAANHEQIWQYMPQKATKDSFNPWFEDCLHKMQSGEQITYVVRNKTCQTILGATAYYNIQLNNRCLALGYSWFVPDAWGSTANPESKLLMLMQAFDCWNVNRIEIGTDSRNTHSYNAIKKLGATEEGVLRQHMILQDNEITDTIMFSILSIEWPEIKKKLMMRLTSGYVHHHLK